MSSLISGYQYDIFISYRQKDNKGDRWVSEFVDALKDELESTFKEEISVYFDINLHDGLLGTHEVTDSLKEKLKCLVFIPVLSRTYCDPKSFAWQNEFKAFVDQAASDQFGLKVRLQGGNVASRVLPVRIHDLDKDDLDLCEAVTGGVLRGVEFIYKSPGVNRPLRPKEDKSQENLNNTIYRDQINKVALAIKDIILGLKNAPAVTVIEELQPELHSEELKKYHDPVLFKKAPGTIRYRLISGIFILTSLIITAFFVYTRFINRDKLSYPGTSGERITVVVMPFQNMTNDAKLNKWQVGIQNELINNLTNSEMLRIQPQESINGLLASQGITNYALIKPSVAAKVSKKLNANILITGSLNESGTILRINAQLTDSRSGDVLQAFKKEGPNEKGDILSIIDPLSKEINNFLIISRLKEEVYIDPERIGSSDSPEAYQFFTYGQKAFARRDFPEAIDMLTQAVKIDSNLTYAILHIGWAYFNQGKYEDARKWCLKAYRKRDIMPLNQATYTNFVHARFFGTLNEAIRYLRQLQEMDDQWPHLYYDMGVSYCGLLQYDRAIPQLEKALTMYSLKNSKPWWPSNYTFLGKAYHETGQYKKEKRLYYKAEEDFPENPEIIQNQAILALSEGNTGQANKYIEKYRSLRKDNSATEGAILTSVAKIYNEAGIPDKAEENYQKALSLQPGDQESLYNLGYFLIDKNRDISKGLELVGKALEASPENYSYLDALGWGLFKQGKFKEALDTLMKSWDMRMRNGAYNHPAYLHLEAARKAVTAQK